MLESPKRRDVAMMQDVLEFQVARRRARIARVFSLVAGKRNRMPFLEDLLDPTWKLGQYYVGVRPIEVGRIVGSESRSRAFDGDFLPLRGFLRDRWTRVNQAWRGDVALAAIRVFELDGRYYVRDGRHRVSVARFHSVAYIDAEIVKITGQAAVDRTAPCDYLRRVM
jgi:hypothetical protein